jgi:dipeptidyl aminopeptidase/acylaminoacyl peptidase
MQIAPYGSWRSPITADSIVTDSIGLGAIVVDGEDIYWLESRPQEQGRNVVVRRTPDGKTMEITPSEYNVRNRVHEYGGAAYTVVDGRVYFSNYSDGCLYVQDVDGQYPQQLAPGKNFRYADLIIDRVRHRLICVREEHEERDLEPLNTLVSVNLDGSQRVEVLLGGNDFYASPCLSPDGSQLAWLSWNHPNLPWDGTNLQLATIGDRGILGAPSLVAGGKDESIFQPQWSLDGTLYFISNRTGWGNLYRWNQTKVESVCPLEAEFSLPQWVFGMSTYAFAGQNRIVCTYTQGGIWQLASINTISKHLTKLHTPYTDISGVRAHQNQLIFCGASPKRVSAVIAINLVSEERLLLRSSHQLTIDPKYISLPQAIEFPTTNGLIAYAFYYPPTNPDYQPVEGEKPPLLVKSHGGPTAATSNQLNLRLQYWTSRGFAVVDVNYGGSTGYGKAYRQRLDGQWGVVDVDDCCNAARYLAKQGLVDPDRLAISGGSAGGYTTLCALTFRDVFKAGASYYGVSDLAALAKDTHKFESRYTDRLVAPYPSGEAIYEARSPINFTHQLSCPTIFFQGLLDRVVPPNQSQMMVTALINKQIPVAYITFPEEQHGFRQSSTIKRALTAEFYFYAQIFGFQPADTIEPVEILGVHSDTFNPAINEKG